MRSLKGAGLLLCWVLASPAVEGRELVIGGIPEVPWRYWDEGVQSFAGLDVDVVGHILGRLDVPHRIVLEPSSARLENNWRQNNTYDMVFTYSYKEARTPYLLYANESHIHIAQHFFILKKNLAHLHYDTLEDLRGMRVGATQGFSYTPAFWAAVDAGLWRTDVVTQNKLQIHKLLHERIDIVPLPTMATLFEAQRGGYAARLAYLPKPLKSEPYYNTFVKSSDYPGLALIAERYDQELREMKRDGRLRAIYERYGVQQHYSF
ncbi:MAG: ABC transporter substrate-binding protein [Pseudomonadota bacterium]